MSQLVIDKLNSIAGWVSSNTAKVSLVLNDFPSLKYLGEGSLRVNIKDSSKDVFFERVFSSSFDISDFEELRFVIQRRTKGSRKYREVKDFSLKVSIGDTISSTYTPKDEWFVPMDTARVFNLVNIDVSGIDSFNTIRFTVAVDEIIEHYFIDNILVVKDEAIIDVLLAVKNLINNQLEFPLGKLGAAGIKDATSVFLSDWANVTRFSVIKITEGALSELHQIESDVSDGDAVSTEVSFSDEFDGRTLDNAFTIDADVSLIVPVQISSKFIRYVEPGITLSGFVPIMGMSRGPAKRLDSFRTGAFGSPANGQVGVHRDNRDVNVPITIEVRAEQPELMALINEFIYRNFEDDVQLSINGFKYDLIYNDNAFSEGDLEGESDSTIHDLTVMMNARFGAGRKFIGFPISTESLTLTFS